MLKVIILEDENKASQMLQDCIKMVAPDCSIEGIAKNLKEGEQIIKDVKPDLAFFDVELPDGHSFDLLARLPEIDFAIIFTTAHGKYAVNAFKYSAIDFIVKPITPNAIKDAIGKAKESFYIKQMREKINNLIENRNRKEEEKKIFLQCADSIYFVAINEVVRCQSDNNYTNVFLDNGDKILITKTIKEFELMLPQSLFFRSHQSHIVNVSYINQIKKKTYQIILKNGDAIQLATRKKEELLKIMKSRL